MAYGTTAPLIAARSSHGPALGARAKASGVAVLGLLATVALLQAGGDESLFDSVKVSTDVNATEVETASLADTEKGRCRAWDLVCKIREKRLEAQRAAQRAAQREAQREAQRIQAVEQLGFPARFALRGGKDNRYCADEGDKIVCNRNSIQGWEIFTAEKVGPREYAIRGGKNTKYCADENGGLKCNRGAANSWERTKVEAIVVGGRVVQKVVGGRKQFTVALIGGRAQKYCADEGNKVICNRDSIAGWERFEVIDLTSVDCVGDYGMYSDCTKACGGGNKHRFYRISTPAAHGGRACPHANNYKDTTACNVENCVHDGLKRAVWTNLHDRADDWHSATGHLVHTLPGALPQGTKPEKPDLTPSNECGLTSSFEAPVDTVQDGGQLISGNFFPPQTGLYEFSLAADDGGELYFGSSVDEKTKIASVHSFLGRPGKSNGDSTLASTEEYFSDAKRESGAVSTPIRLVAGRKYYISAVQVNRQGRDALSVAAKGGSFPSDAPIPVTYGGQTILSYTATHESALSTCVIPEDPTPPIRRRRKGPRPKKSRTITG